MKVPDPKTFSKIVASLMDCPNGETFLEWCRQNMLLDSYDSINPHNTSRNEGRRSTFRDIIEYAKKGADPNAYQEEAET